MTTYCFDIDGTICSNSNGEYERAEPFHDRIAHILSLERQGHTIVFFTARGSQTLIDWRDFTLSQLKSWGISNPVVHFLKPFADIYVDDRAVSDKEFFNNEKS